MNSSKISVMFSPWAAVAALKALCRLTFDVQVHALHLVLVFQLPHLLPAPVELRGEDNWL